MVAYSGPFVSAYRSQMSDTWIQKLDEIGVDRSEGITMSKFLGVPVKI
jgi:hypothetical protein